MKQTYPLSRLVLVTPDEPADNVHQEVEKIMDHRRRRGQLEYFVKWKAFSESENAWVKESDFDTTDIIEDYWNNTTEPPQLTETVTETAVYYLQTEAPVKSAAHLAY
jgi:hypothetical protein